jgi:hypothetical protein
MCKLGMTKSELRRLAAAHPRFFSFRARAVRPKLLLLRTEVCISHFADLPICPLGPSLGCSMQQAAFASTPRLWEAFLSCSAQHVPSVTLLHYLRMGTRGRGRPCWPALDRYHRSNSSYQAGQERFCARSEGHLLPLLALHCIHSALMATAAHLQLRPGQWQAPGSQSRCPEGAASSVMQLPAPCADALSRALCQRHLTRCL